MAKKATFNTDSMVVENGMITGLTINEAFKIRMASGDDVESPSAWSVNITVEQFMDMFWAGAKVKMRSATLKKLSERDIRALDDSTCEVADYIAAAPVDRKAAKAAIVNGLVAEATKKFYQKALEQAVEELEEGATTEEITTLAGRIFDEQYATIINSLA